GMFFLTLTAGADSLHPADCGVGEVCEKASSYQLAVLFIAFAFLVIGSAGIRPCSMPFGADQFDPHTESGKRGINSFFNWYYFTFTSAMLVSATVIIYVQSNVNWAIGLGIPTALMFLACVLFFMGTRLYVRVVPEGSPFTTIVQVFAAAFAKRSLKQAKDPKQDLFDPPHTSAIVTKLAHTDQFRCLDKAAMVASPRRCAPAAPRGRPLAALHRAAGGGGEMPHPHRARLVHRDHLLRGRGAAVHLRRLLRAAVGPPPRQQLPRPRGVLHRLRHARADALDPHLRPPPRAAPPQGHRQGRGLHAAPAPGHRDRALHRGHDHLRRRRGPAQGHRAQPAQHRHDADGGGISAMSSFWMVPQLMILGLSEAFNLISQIEFYYKEIPEHMRSVAGALAFCNLALGNYLSGFLTTIVHRTTGGGQNWLAQDLNKGRLDLFYWMIAGIGVFNFVYFMICARWYRFKGTRDA
ncbi:hypothetical protein CFC21_060237, partial [Triticum aestivum]